MRTDRLPSKGIIQTDADLLVGLQRDIDELPFWDHISVREIQAKDSYIPGLFTDQIPTVSSSPFPSLPDWNIEWRALPMCMRLLSASA